ncbi:efflux RND transporter periplasmic adaptor subunit [Adhaeribacter sp. BT258]|uniref:Efflux RND transporter periplasmic adaptor subunit n=1 Tax=Adhaeribacter terrigena TaxID=2793070 RepID=A0ABS1C5Y3_9BACT|nr:efflux RND transporter periplasmic adaptor subunit [Adhaeribacter terrigena]MBK0403970.1 efflux RND transporter periplasmic adaptor subunit [Adhaeribacter terrigena]
MDRILEKKTWTPKKIALIAAGVILAVFLFYTLVFADHKASLNVNNERITIGQTTTGNFQEFIAIDGNVEPLKTIYLDMVEGGRVEKLYTDDGRKINAGDTILKISNSTLQIDFLNRETQLFDLVNERQNSEITMKQDQIKALNALAEIEYNLKQAENKYKRSKNLFAEKVIPQAEYEQTEDEFNYLKRRKELAERSLKQDAELMTKRLRQLDQSINRMQQNINIARSTLSNLYITAPISGQLSTLKAEVGESKTAGENIGQIDDLNGFKVKASIDEHYISKVYPGLKAAFDFNGQTHSVSVAKVFPEVQNGQFQVDLEFPEGKTPEGIRRGQSLQIRLHLSGGDKATLIPRGGFYQSTGGAWAFVVDKSGKFAEKRTIKLGRQNPQYYEVLAGLKPGDQVIVSSYDGYGDIEKLNLED